MKILLVDVDSKDGNLALAKFSAYYKDKGNNVDLLKLAFKGYPHNKTKIIDGKEYDKVLVSNLFDNNKDRYSIINCSDVSIGGMGSNYPHVQMKKEIHDYPPDQTFFKDGISRGYLTRGCVRQCYFCKVWKYEGLIKTENTIQEIAKTKKVKFLDNNILAYKNHYKILEELVDLQLRSEFNQGLDIRLLNDENANLLSKMNYMNEYIFAFDNIEDEELINKKFKLFKKYVDIDWKSKFYVYHNEEFGNLSDLKHRVEWCRDRKVLPYVMRDINCWSSVNKNFLIDYASYVNQPAMFKKLTFEEFLYKRYTNQNRISEVINIYNKIL